MADGELPSLRLRVYVYNPCYAICLGNRGCWSIFTIFLLHWINKLALFDRALPFTVVYIIEPWERLPSLARRRSDFNRFSLWVWLIDGFIRILSRHSMSSRALWEDLEKIWKVRNFWIFCGCKFWFWFVMDKKVSINYFVREFNI